MAELVKGFYRRGLELAGRRHQRFVRVWSVLSMHIHYVVSEYLISVRNSDALLRYHLHPARYFSHRISTGILATGDHRARYFSPTVSQRSLRHPVSHSTWKMLEPVLGASCCS